MTDRSIYYEYDLKICLYHYVVRMDVNGLESILKADLKPILRWKGLPHFVNLWVLGRDSLNREAVGYRWEGGYLAQALNEDDELKNLLSGLGLHRLEIRPDKMLHCVWMTPIFPLVSKAFRHVSPVDRTLAFLERAPIGRNDLPTQKHFKAYDRIAYIIRKIAKANHG